MAVERLRGPDHIPIRSEADVILLSLNQTLNFASTVKMGLEPPVHPRPLRQCLHLSLLHLYRYP